jgi:hypothetical protein
LHHDHEVIDGNALARRLLGVSVCSGMAPFLNSHASRRSIALRYFDGSLLTVASTRGGKRDGGKTEADSVGSGTDAIA